MPLYVTLTTGRSASVASRETAPTTRMLPALVCDQLTVLTFVTDGDDDPASHAMDPLGPVLAW